jgi:signal transduction histidine kinase
MPGLAVELELDPDLRLPTVEQGEAVVRCVQGALTNAARHAQAKRVVVRVARDGARVRLTIADDGRGSAALAPGNGISGMRERIAALGGEVEFTTAPGRGFVVAASLPAA